VARTSQIVNSDVMRGKITKSKPAQRRTTKQLRRTAIHEAGHAVVGRVLGMTCGEATIVPSVAAVANAIFNATGRRIKDLPITRDKILGVLA